MAVWTVEFAEPLKFLSFIKMPCQELQKVDPKCQDLPAAYRGHCCLDVDLAFVGPADPRMATPVGHDGTLAFEVRSLRVPPLDHGYVSLRVCEAAKLDNPTDPTPKTACEKPEIRGATENGAILERKMLQNRALEAAQLSRSRALWSSGCVLLGSWAGFLGLETTQEVYN